MKVVLNGVDVTDNSHKLHLGHMGEAPCLQRSWLRCATLQIPQRRQGNRSDNRGGRGERNYNGGGQYVEIVSNNSIEQRNVSATITNSAEIVEYDASNTTFASQSPYGRGGQRGGRFGPRWNN
jgi:hypothetical protein